MSHRHEELPPGEECALCWFGVPLDWTPETCDHRYSVSMMSLLDADGETLTYSAECDACGAALPV
jgi:hypothetical protein